MEIPKGYTLVCDRCGAEFKTLYFDRGQIEHDNKTSDWNLKVFKNNGTFYETVDKYNEIDKKCALIWERNFENILRR